MAHDKETLTTKLTHKGNKYVTFIVQDRALLSRMSEDGHVTYDKKHLYVTHYTSSVFQFEGKWYECKYYDGCFNPFVTITKKQEG